jgi:M6 family metalloprotease-like protein
MRRSLTVFLIIAFAFIPVNGAAQIYPPKPGVELPTSHLEQLKRDRTAFQFERAWIQKAERIKRNREAYIEERGFFYRPFLTAGQLAEMAVTGTIAVPVFCSKYANTGSDPYPTSALDQKLFTGPNPPQTLTQFYSEISYGDITMTGTVYGWFQLSQNDTYYEGPAGCYGTCGSANTGQFITETLNAWDATVDFGQYDNDGPDGIPNSGDDDGYVDFAAFVQPEVGAECGGNNNIWSHRWVLSGWIGGYGWTSNDVATGHGRNIRVNDYVMQPAWNCGGTTVIDIGVFCHEFGHAFGLPDLYDTNGGSSGIGEWGLMGSGSWNTVTQPAHMSAWSKSELGWANLVEVGTNPSNYPVSNVEYNRPVYRAKVMRERWKRVGGCAISGTSMRCGFSPAEATARSWPGGEGYGNLWVERVSRDFRYDGSIGPIWLDYDYRYDSETGYDYTYAQIDVGGTVSNLVTYNGSGTGTAHIDISPYLVGGGPTDYTLYFEFQSDYAVSDEDYGDPQCYYCTYQSTCGPFVFDNVSVNGGGESYFTDFEAREDGWWVDMTDPSECFIVENRQPLGSDVNLHGGGGLCIWHVDQAVANSWNGNTGGASGNQPHGVGLEQADGLDQLGAGIGRGDAGDPYPGSTANMLFSGLTTPNSNAHDGTPSNVSVQLITGNGDPITISATGGWFPPTITSSNPPSSSDVEWIGHDYVIAEFDINGAPPGGYDIILTNPGGGSFGAPDAFTIVDAATGVDDTPPVPETFALRQNYPNPFNPVTTIPIDVRERARVTLRIYNLRGQVVRTLVDGVLDARSYGIEWNGRNDAGRMVPSGVYFCKLAVGDFQDVRKMVLTK